MNDQIAAEAADKFLSWRYDGGKPQHGMEREHLISDIQSAISKQREIDFGWARKMFKDVMNTPFNSGSGDETR